MRSRLLCLTVLFAFAGCAQSAGPTTAPLIDGKQADVAVVLDGDSLDVSIDGERTEVRLLGINAPERDECFDQEARAALSELAGSRVSLAATELDQFGRTLAYVTNESGVLVNLELVTNGFALALTSDHERLSQFKAAEQEAFEARAGLWSTDACGPSADTNVIIRRIQADAPGDDAQQPEGEWVEIRNEGREPLSMAGWVLRDESSRHRFIFRSDYSLPSSTTLRILSGMGNNPGVGDWSADEPVWSNRGDTAYLLDPAGNIVYRLGY